MHRAAYSGHSDIAKILAEHGSKLDLVDIDGQTALHKAKLIYAHANSVIAKSYNYLNCYAMYIIQTEPFPLMPLLWGFEVVWCRNICVH